LPNIFQIKTTQKYSQINSYQHFIAAIIVLNRTLLKICIKSKQEAL